MKTNQLSLALAAVFALGAYNASAENDIQQGLYLAPSFTYILYDKDYDLDDGAGASISFGYKYESPWSAEITLLMAESQFKNETTAVDGEHFQVRMDGLYHIEQDRDIHPFVVAGLGYGEWEYDNDTNTDDNQLNVGVGLISQAGERYAWRSDLRLVYDLDEGGIHSLVNIGVSYFFGAGKKPTPPVAVVDTDEDSVPDDQDQCPSTPLNAPVLSNGCPKDSDNDSVSDFLDQCPGTAAGIAVTPNGCAADSDNDGIPDSIDACAATPTHARVDEKGCRVKLLEAVKISMQINFKSGSADVLAEHYSEIGKAGEFMRQYPDSAVIIEGHSDSQGAAAFNKRLSQKRADSVREYLIKMYNVDESRIVAKGFGEASPIADNASREGRAKNRRVVAIIKGTVLR